MTTAPTASRRIIRWLIVNWKSVSPGVGGEDSGFRIQDSGAKAEREARLKIASETLGRPVATFSDLSMEEALKLVARWKQEMGEEFKGPVRGFRRRRRGSGLGARVSGAEVIRICEVAAELFGQDWDRFLRERLCQRYLTPDTRNLTPRQARDLAEELLQRIAVRNIRKAKMEKRKLPEGSPVSHFDFRISISRREIEAEKLLLRKRFFTTETQRKDDR